MKALLATVVLLAVTTPATAKTVSDPDCELPPSGAWPTDAEDQGTFDAKYTARYTDFPDTIDYLVNGMRCEKDDWDDGWGWGNWADLDRMLSRLLNAAFIVDRVQLHAKHYGLALSVKGIPSGDYERGYWWSFVSQYGTDEWEPTCDTDDYNASYGYSSADWYYTLYPTGAYRYSAANRASTLVHETTHEDVDHIAEDDCSPATVSCDSAYGVYNANTMQINFLLDAVTTFKTVGGTNGVKRMVVKSDSMCGFVPYFSDVEMTSMMARAESVAERFATPAVLPLWEVAASTAASIWTCTDCDASVWDFDPGLCVQTACNEIINDMNKQINATNKELCYAFNDALTDLQGPDDVYNAKVALDSATLVCAGPSEAGSLAYCAQQVELADTVADLDTCGWLNTTWSSSYGKLACVETFCKEKFDEAGGPEWMDGNDPFGCMDYLCGDACTAEESTELCRFAYLYFEGDPEEFSPTCEFRGCGQFIPGCVFDLYKKGEWAFGQPVPVTCIESAAVMKALCEKASALAAMVAISVVPEFGPSPMTADMKGPDVTTPVAGFDDLAAEVLAAAETGGDATHAAVELTAAPELAAYLFHKAPGKMAWLYGADSFESSVGPPATFSKPKEIAEGELAPAGQQALAELKALVGGAPGGKLKGSFGTFAFE